MIFDKDFADFIKILQKHNARFVLVGGLAVIIHGHFRTTKDMDIYYDPNPQNAGNMLAAIKEFGFGYLQLTMDDIMDKSGYIQMGKEPYRIDLLCDLPGIEFTDVYDTAIDYTEEEITFKVIQVNKLLDNKRAVGRLQDLDDVKKLEKIIKRKK